MLFERQVWVEPPTFFTHFKYVSAETPLTLSSSCAYGCQTVSDQNRYSYNVPMHLYLSLNSNLTRPLLQ